jgi:hypothetical protein
MKTIGRSGDREEGGGRECSTQAGPRWYLRFPRSQRVKEREAPENVEARLVTGTDFLGHTLQYGHLRSHFSSWRGSGRLPRNLRVPTRSRSVGSHSLQGFYRSAVETRRGPLPRSSPRYPAELSQFPQGLLNEAFRKLFWSHAAGGSVRRDSFINLA